MKLGNLIKALAVLFVSVQADVCMGLEIYDANYMVEEYARFTSSNPVSHLNFDAAGNLYMLEMYNGRVLKVDTNKTQTVLASGLGSCSNMVWGGGTAYGDNMYVLSTGNNVTYKISASGNKSVFATMSYPYHAATAIAIDESGYYANQMFFGTSGLDRLGRITADGNIYSFTNWPGQTGGSVQGIAFDVNGTYGNSMYVSTDFPAPNTHKAGVFKVDIFGNATRFSSYPICAGNLLFDETGLMFGGKLYAIGDNNYNPSVSAQELWQLDTNGNAVLFGKVGRDAVFGNDGALYVAESVGNQIVVSRVYSVPEPGITSLLVLGAVWLGKLRK